VPDDVETAYKMVPELTDLNLSISTSDQMIDGKFEVGQTKVWMGLKNKGKPDILRNVRWNGAKPFAVWTFDVDDGETLGRPGMS
jgi:hypothetical protein